MSFDSIPPKISGNESVNQPFNGNVKSKSKQKDHKSAEISKTAQEALKTDDVALDKSLKATKHQLNHNGNGVGTEEKLHEVGTDAILSKNKVPKGKNSDSSNDVELSQTHSSNESITEKPLEEMTEEELMKYLEDQAEAISELEAEDISIAENVNKLARGLSVKTEYGSKIVSDLAEFKAQIRQAIETPEDAAKMVRTWVKGEKCKDVKLADGEHVHNKITELTNAGQHIFFFTGKANPLFLPLECKSEVEAQGYFDVPDFDGNIIQIPRSQIRFLGEDEFLHFIEDIRQHIENLHNASIVPEELEPEPEEEKEPDEVQKQPQQQAAVAHHEKPETDLNVKERSAFGKAEEKVNKSGPSIAEMGRRSLAETENYFKLKNEKIRKQLEQEEIIQEEVKRNERKASIKETDANRHDMHVDIANIDAEIKEMQQKLKSLSESTFTVPTRKVLKEVQVFFDKVNTLNPNQKNTVALKKEILDVAKELVKMSKEMKSVSEGSDRVAGSGMA